MAAFSVIEYYLANDVAGSGTFTVNYPTGADSSTFEGGWAHKLNVNGATLAAPGEFTLTFGASNITVTLASTVSISGGVTVYLEVDERGIKKIAAPDADIFAKTVPAEIRIVNLGAPDTADADGAVASQACTAVSGLATGINGALASDGVATFDVPRNVVAAWTGTAVLTVTGTDEYGAVVVESSASGTSLAGKKALKTVTGVSTSADITGLTVGTGDVLGLPFVVEGAGLVLSEMEDGAKATAGTVVPAVVTAATATTGDVRGTYDPNSAANGARTFELAVMVTNESKGVPQFAG